MTIIGGGGPVSATAIGSVAVPSSAIAGSVKLLPEVTGATVGLPLYPADDLFPAEDLFPAADVWLSAAQDIPGGVAAISSYSGATSYRNQSIVGAAR